MAKLIAVFYNEWGVPVAFRAIRWYFLYPMSELINHVNEPVNTTVKTEVFEFPYQHLVKYQKELQVSPYRDVDAFLCGRCGVVTERITDITHDGVVHNDSLQLLCCPRFARGFMPVLMCDWKGNVAWRDYEQLRALAIAHNIYMPNLRTDVIEVRDNSDYRSDSVNSLIDSGIFWANLSNLSYEILPLRGLRRLNLGDLQTVMVPDFWNVVVSNNPQLQSLSSPRKGAVHLNGCESWSLKAPEICYGLVIEQCGVCNDLVLPKTMKELHPNGGAMFCIWCKKLPAKLRKIDMSDYHDLVWVELLISSCALETLVVKVPKFRYDMVWDCIVSDDTRDLVPPLDQSVNIVASFQLRELSFIQDNKDEEVVDTYSVSLGNSPNLEHITIDTNTLFDMEFYSLARHVTFDINKSCGLTLDLRFSDCSIVSAIIFNTAALDISGEDDFELRLKIKVDVAFKVVTSNFEYELQLFNSGKDDCVLLCLRPELLKYTEIYDKHGRMWRSGRDKCFQ